MYTLSVSPVVRAQPALRKVTAMDLLLACIALAAVATSLQAAPEGLPAPAGWASPSPAPETPGPGYAPPIAPGAAPAEGAPRVYEHTADAGPDETFFVVGSALSPEVFVWGSSPAAAGGQAWPAKVQFAKPGYLAATLPERALDGPFLVWARGAAGWSRPFRLNAPQPWWCGPDRAAPGETVRVFGRDLARRPDRSAAFVYLCQPGRRGRWLEGVRPGKYALSVPLPDDLAPGGYEIWVHAGCGGAHGWGGPVTLTVEARPPGRTAQPPLNATGDSPDVQAAVDRLAAGGGVLRLGKGTFPFRGTLIVPAGVAIEGAGMDETRLQLTVDPQARFPRPGGPRWGQAPSGIHTPGDTIEYSASFPASGEWSVWLRYATEMSQWNQPGVSGNMTLQVDDGAPVPLENLPNTGSFATYKWSRSARIRIGAGTHTLRWQNAKGGGISLDAFVFALAPAFQPSDAPHPAAGDRVVVVQGEDATRFLTKEGSLGSGDAATVWLAGDGAGVRNLSISGNGQANLGILVRSAEPLAWVRDCRVEGVRVTDVEGKQAENCGIRLISAAYAVVAGNELWGRCPLYLSGVRQCRFSDNRLVSATRWGGNSEAAIQGRNETIEECIIEGNRVACPPGAEAGGPTARRLIWVSTGRGSVTRNWMAGNGVEAPAGPGAGVGADQARFGGVAGTDQNVGEMILFEANHRTMYFGALAGADARSVTLPRTLPPTPDNRLGGVKREQLAHDADGNETPFWPPDAEDESPEPPIGEYYVTIFQGPGQGQTRRVVRREGECLVLDGPWREPPSKESVVAVGTAFYRNLVVGNHTPDGMTGVQLWISCIENVVARNTVARHRKQGLFLYANGTTLASSMPRTWNRGISPLFFNHVEGTRTDECSAGALVTSGDSGDLPIEFPRALGNVLRHNSFIRSRTDGVILVSRKGEAAKGDSSPSILGTIVELNVVRDAPVAYHAGSGSDGVVFRRNHAYFWYPVNNSTEPPVAFQVDTPGATVAIEANSVEGKTGTGDREVVEVKRAEAAAP